MWSKPCVVKFKVKRYLTNLKCWEKFVVPHKRQSPDLGTLEVESIEICSIEIRIARKKKNKSQQKLRIFFKLDINHFYLPKLQLYKFICDDLHLLINEGWNKSCSVVWDKKIFFLSKQPLILTWVVCCLRKQTFLLAHGCFRRLGFLTALCSLQNMNAECRAHFSFMST